MGTAEYHRVPSCFLAISHELNCMFTCTHQKANLIRPRSKFDKYGKFSSNLLITKAIDFYESLKICWMSFLLIPWRKARRLELFTNAYEVIDHFGDRKSDFYYLAKNEKNCYQICFSSEIGKIDEVLTMTVRWFELPTFWCGVRTAINVATYSYVNRTVVQPFENFVYKLQGKVLLYN